MHIEVFKGQRKWYWHLMANNGQIVATSQAYFQKFNAMRAARKLAVANSWPLYHFDRRGIRRPLETKA